MDYISVVEVAKKWNISERSVRNYCAQNRVPGAFLTGKTWNIPAYAEKPKRSSSSQSSLPSNSLLTRLREEKASQIKGGIYHKVQVELTYNSNRIEGSKLTIDQTRFIFETATIGAEDSSVLVDDIIETVNHFRCIDQVIEKANKPLSKAIIKNLHATLKGSTRDAGKKWFAVGDWKKLPNEVGGQKTTLPEQVDSEITKLLTQYHATSTHTIEDIIDFHASFEKIHPFQDGNGRVGRLIMFKECLASNIVPFVIADDMKAFYYRGLAEYDYEKGYLVDTCLAAQDQFAEWVKYFRIEA